jgi:hypothetical protein
MKLFSEQHLLGILTSLQTFRKARNWGLKKVILLSPLLLLSGAGEAVAEADGPCERAGFRYADCGNGTVTDAETGLIWLKNANCENFGPRNWADTAVAAADLANGQCGLTDGSSPGEWHLPFWFEWERTAADAREKNCMPFLTDATGDRCYSEGSSPFINVQNGFYWTAAVQPNAPGTAWALSIPDTTGYNYRDQAYGWPVRGNNIGINKESCKNNGWQALGFRNQGLCIKALM